MHQQQKEQQRTAKRKPKRNQYVEFACSSHVVSGIWMCGMFSRIKSIDCWKLSTHYIDNIETAAQRDVHIFIGMWRKYKSCSLVPWTFTQKVPLVRRKTMDLHSQKLTMQNQSIVLMNLHTREQCNPQPTNLFMLSLCHAKQTKS